MADQEQVESPWDGPAPSYRAVPQLNPKTNKPVKFYACMSCGAAIVSKKVHDDWHRKMHSAMMGPPF